MHDNTTSWSTVGVTFTWRRYLAVCLGGGGTASETRTNVAAASPLGDNTGDSGGIDGLSSHLAQLVGQPPDLSAQTNPLFAHRASEHC